MGHEEEDKELMMIRMETLKSMIGKLKNKTSQNSSKDINQPSIVNEKPNLVKDKSHIEKKSGNSRPSSSTFPSSPPNYNKSSIISKSNPSSPLSTNNSRSNILNIPPLVKSKSQQNLVHRPTSGNQLSNYGASSGAVKTDAIPMKSNPSILVHQSPYKVSYQSQPKANLPTLMSANVSKNKLHLINDSYKSSQTSLNSNHAPLYVSKSLSSSSSKSFSDSEISSRKSLMLDSSVARTNSVFKSLSSAKNNGSHGSPSKPSSQPTTSKHSKTDKPTNVSTITSTSINQRKIKPVLNSIDTLTKPATKLVKNTHTVTKPSTEEITRTKTDTRYSNQVLTTSRNSLKKSNSPEPGKILFERTGKVLFDRHSSQQNRSIPNPKGSFMLNNKQTFAQEFKVIRNKHTSMNAKPNVISAPQKVTTRTKFYASDYHVPPETCEKARTILSKYKVVRKKDNSHVSSTKKDINANYPSISLSVGSPSPVPSGRILYQKPKLLYGNGSAIGNRSAYLRKGRVYYPTGKIPYLNFVSRRIKYIKSVEPNPFAMQQLKPSSIVTNKTTKKEIILSRHGTNYQVAGNLKSLRRLSANQGSYLKHASPSKPVVRNIKSQLPKPGLSSKNVTAKQYVASQVLKKTRLTARKKVEKEKEFCIFYNRYGKCKRGEKCHFIHDQDKIAICTRFLRGTCKDEGCLFSHKLDPDKMPVCSYFLRGECGRDDCPYRHVNVGESASICDDFLKGYCPKGKECVKKHILECEEFSNTGSCSKRKSCNLAHRQDKPRKRKYSGSRPPKGFRQKRKRIGSQGDEEQHENENEAKSPTRPNEGKKHMLPKFVSENIKLLRESSSEKPTSFAGLKKFYEATKIEKENSKANTDLWGSDFIPLTNYSGGESDEESSEYIQRPFTFKK